MNCRRGFTLMELAVVFVIIVLIVFVFLPLIAPHPARRTARSMQNTTHVAGIHKGLFLFAQNNRGWYPGLTSVGQPDGASIPAFPGMYGTDSMDGTEPVYRFALLMRGNFFSPEYILTPAETRLGSKPNEIKAPTKGEPMKAGIHYSYAMLRIDQAGPRREEWSATNSVEAPVVSDRNISPTAGATAQSNHTAVGDGWRGTVAYNDGHAQFETSNILKTWFRTYSRDENGAVTELNFHSTKLDDLFADDKDDKGKSGNDAGMVFQDPTTYVNQ